MTARARVEDAVVVGSANVPTEWGVFRCVAFRAAADGVEHLAFVRGDVDGSEPVLVRVHSECLTGDVFGSRRCDCGPQLAAAMELVAERDHGVVVYLRGHEGRGIGIGHKIRAYELQDQGLDTVDANIELGLPVDARDYAVGASILSLLDVRNVRLITNNPAKHDELERFGLHVVERVPSVIAPTAENVTYLRTKRERMGHLIAEHDLLVDDADGDILLPLTDGTRSPSPADLSHDR